MGAEDTERPAPSIWAKVWQGLGQASTEERRGN